MSSVKIGVMNAASPTPLTADGALDRDSAKRLCRRWLDVDLDGVLAKDGRMREAFTLDRERTLCMGQLYNRFSHPLQNIVGQKYALRVLGCIAHEATAVHQPLDDASRERIEKTVEEFRAWLE